MTLRNAWLALAAASLLSACQHLSQAPADTHHQLLISIPDQQMVLLEDGVVQGRWPVSTARRGVGDEPDSYMTPAGELEVAEKIGDGLPPGSVLKDRKPTGEIVGADAPGRDPVVTRILWLRGLEERNRNAYQRFIYIHGTPQESLIGQPASYGCIRMRSADITGLYARIGAGTRVRIAEQPLSELLPR